MQAKVIAGRVICFRCGRATRQRVLPETKAKNLPIYCQFCKAEQVVDIVPEPEPKSQRQS